MRTVRDFFTDILVTKQGDPCEVLARKMDIEQCMSLNVCVGMELLKRGYDDTALDGLALDDPLPEQYMGRVRGHVRTLIEMLDDEVPDYPFDA